jgi:hypothetical protein
MIEVIVTRTGMAAIISSGGLGCEDVRVTTSIAHRQAVTGRAGVQIGLALMHPKTRPRFDGGSRGQTGSIRAQGAETS